MGSCWRRLMRSEQSTHRFPSVTSGAPKLIAQLTSRPWGLAAFVPVAQDVERLVVVQREASNEPAADLKRMNVAMLACDRRRHRLQVSPRPLDGGSHEGAHQRAPRWRPGRRLRRSWEVFGPVAGVDVQVLDRHQMRLGTFVVEKAGQPRGLCYRSCRGVRLELAGKVLLQALDRRVIKTFNTPEDVNVIGGRVKNIAGLWQVAARPHTCEDPGPIVVSIEKHMSNCRDGISGAGAAASGDGVDADEDVEHPGIHRSEPALNGICLDPPEIANAVSDVATSIRL